MDREELDFSVTGTYYSSEPRGEVEYEELKGEEKYHLSLSKKQTFMIREKIKVRGEIPGG